MLSNLIIFMNKKLNNFSKKCVKNYVYFNNSHEILSGVKKNRPIFHENLNTFHYVIQLKNFYKKLPKEKDTLFHETC